MFRHAATVDNYPFICFLSDDQRAMSLGADARELFDIVHIRKSSEFRLHMPLFFVEEMLYWLIYPRFQRKYGDYRFRRGDNTLGMHLYKAFVKVFKDHYDRVWNTFGYYVLDVQIEDGAVEGVFKDGKIYLSSKKIIAAALRRTVLQIISMPAHRRRASVLRITSPMSRSGRGAMK